MNNKIKGRVVLAIFSLVAQLFISILVLNAQSVTTVTSENNPNVLAQALTWSNPGTIVTNATLNCPGSQNPSGTFATTGSISPYGIQSGILLTSGSVNNVFQSNTGNTTVSNNGIGDPDWNILTTNSTTDVCILEFDLFVPPIFGCVSCGYTITFDYVFASEEYNDYVNSAFNDVFGFFISGPGITGNENIALIPGTGTSVTINNINCGLNPQYYICNDANSNTQGGCNPALCPTDNLNTTVQHDGFTKVLTASRTVTRGNTYHMKIGVADVGDNALDSGLFLKSGNVSSNCASFLVNATTTNSTCGLPNAAITANPSGGTSPYTYLWSNSQTSSSIQSIAPGSYAVTVSAGNGCTASAGVIVNNSMCPKVSTQSTVTNVTQNSALINWSAVSCASKYRVVLKNVTTGVQTTTIVTAPNTSLNLNSLQANTTYQVRIRTQCSQNGSVLAQLSPIASFTTLNSQGIQCLPPANVSTSGITASSAQINWTPATGAIQYNLRYRKVGTSTWTNTIISNGSASSITVQNLTASTTYEFQLRTKCNSNPDEFSPYSALNVFNTLAQRIEETETLSTLIYPNPTNNNINVVINAVSETQTTIRITDVLGRVLLNETEELIGGNNTITYNIGDYAAGVYLVHVGNGNTQQVYKVVKE